MRYFLEVSLIFLVFLVFLLPNRTIAGMAKFENNYDRPGGKYLIHYKNIGSPTQCMNLCKGKPGCMAFPWVRPGIQGPGGFCWLKSTVTQKVFAKCCVSGLVSKGPVKMDYCQWFQGGSSYECKCKNSKTNNWYLTNPSACTQPKPSPRYLNPNRNRGDGPGGGGVFGQD